MLVKILKMAESCTCYCGDCYRGLHCGRTSQGCNK